MKDIRLGRI